MEPTETLTFLGTIPELIDEVKQMGHGHWIKEATSNTVLKIDLSCDVPGPSVRMIQHNLWNSSRDKQSSPPRRNNIVTATRRGRPTKALGIVSTIQRGSTVDLMVYLETDPHKELFDEVHARWGQLRTWLVSRGRLGQESEAQREIDGGQDSEAPDDENQLRQAIYSIEHDPSTKEWWRSVALLFWGCKRKNIKMTYEKLAAILGLTDPKYVGERMREYKPPKTT